MPAAFDPSARPTVRLAAHREPAFVFPDQAAGAARKLADFAARTGRRPNVLDLACNEAFREGFSHHMRTFQAYPPKTVMGLGAG